MSLRDPLLLFPDHDYVGEWQIPCYVGGSDIGFAEGLDAFRELVTRASPIMRRVKRSGYSLPATVDVYLLKAHPSGRSDYSHSAMLQQATFSHVSSDFRYVHCATAYADNYRTEAKRVLGLGRYRDVSQTEFVEVPQTFACSTLLKMDLSVLLGVRSCVFTDPTGKRVFRMQLIVGDTTAWPAYGLTWRQVLDKVIPVVDDVSRRTPPWLFNYSTRMRIL